MITNYVQRIMNSDDLSLEQKIAQERRLQASMLYDAGLITYNEALCMVGKKQRDEDGVKFIEQVKEFGLGEGDYLRDSNL
jgi:hypothetical protein